MTLENRSPECIEAWPECENGGYDPRCCRFPKSCSCGSDGFPKFNTPEWREKMTEHLDAKFREDMAALGYEEEFVEKLLELAKKTAAQFKEFRKKELEALQNDDR